MSDHRKGNKYAAKPADERAESFLHIRCRREDKALWVRAAQKEGINLTEWTIRTLTTAVETA